MSYFEDYIEDGLCCEQCGELIDDDEPGYVRVCAACLEPEPAKPAKKRKDQP